MKFTVQDCLEDNWDGEGAEPPSRQALVRAMQVISELTENGTKVEEVDADVRGGVAIYTPDHWIAIMNDGTETQTLRRPPR